MNLMTKAGINLTNSIINHIDDGSLVLDDEILLQDLYSYIFSTHRRITRIESSNTKSQNIDNLEIEDALSTVNINPTKNNNINEYPTIDPRFIFVVDQKIIELIAIPNEESDLNNFKNKYKIDAETWVKIKELKNEFNNEKTKLEREKPNCPSCEIGALNRKYITKLLPYLENEAGNKFLEDLDTIFLKYNQEITDLESLKLNFSETKSLLKQMDEELKKQTKDGKTCSTCAMNSLKNKYLQLARSMYHIKINSLTNLK